MNITEFSIHKQVFTYAVTFLLIIAGFSSFFSLGQLEDPDFTVKNALIVTSYPGATAKEVEQEVTDLIEGALQEMPELDSLHSLSRAGSSLIKVEIKSQYWSDKLPQIWDMMRRKVNDIQSQLPAGALPSQIADDFGDVFGLVLGVVGDDYSYRELEHYAKLIQKEIGLVSGVARVDLWGLQTQAIFLDVSDSRLASLGITRSAIGALLEKQNLIVDAGHAELGSLRFNIQPTGAFRSAEDIGNLLISGNSVNAGGIDTLSRGKDFLFLRDLGTVQHGYIDPPQSLMRIDGQPGLALAVSNIRGSNVVEMGNNVNQRLNEIQELLPYGIEVKQIHWQSDIVNEAVGSFMINFIEAMIIVLVVLTLAMGWRMGVIIGTALTITVLGTFIAMAILSIDLHRISLGALIIAMGMMVDNAIVVAESYVVRITKGEDKIQAAINSATKPSLPLLGATIVAVMTFYPIFASTEDAGEYCRTLFLVVGISLLLSWVISLTITPLQCMHMLSAPPSNQQQEKSRWSSGFQFLLEKTLHMRGVVIVTTLGLLIVSIIGFGNVKQIFFPSSSMTKLMIDYWTPEGTRIQQTSENMKILEKNLLEDERIENIATFIGQGPPRFYLPVDPEYPYSSYGQIIVNVKSLDLIDDVRKDVAQWTQDNIPGALVRVRKYGVGPSKTWNLEARFLGPSLADPTVLRDLSDKGLDILRASNLTREVSTDWRQQSLDVVPVYSQAKGRNSGISRDDMAAVTKRVYDGVMVGVFRLNDDELPIILRESEDKQNISSLDTLQIQPPGRPYTVPLGQVTDEIKTDWHNPLIWRYDRHRAITVRATAIDSITTEDLRLAVSDAFDEIELPPGYNLHWFGEYKDTVDAQTALLPGVLPALAIILLIIIALFNDIRPLLSILAVIPFAMIGVTAGLLAFDASFGFVALLGAMSLVGMMIKNAIVLLDEINTNKELGKSDYQSVVDAAVARLRPVFLAAATTVLGVAPLLTDVFWQGLGISVMVGLTFGTFLTMFLLPIFYSIFYRIKV